MIKPSVILALIGACAALALAFALVKEDRPAINAPVNAGSRLVTGFDTSKVKAIDIKKGDVAVRLEKKDANWVMATQKNRPANTQRIDDLLKNTAGATVDNERPGDAKVFALDEKGRTTVTFEKESDKTTVLLGKSPEYSKGFAKNSESGPVYEIDKELDKNAGIRTEKDERILDPAYFYDLKVFSFAQDDIIDIVIKKGHEVVRVQRVIPGKGPQVPKEEPAKDDPKPVWWITEPEGFAAEDGAVNTICSSVAFLNAKSYADTIAEKDRGLDKPIARVLVRLKDGAEHTLTFGRIENDDVVVSIAGKPDPYTVYKYVYESMTKSYKDLKKGEPKPDTAGGPNFGPNFGPNGPGGMGLPPDGEQINKEALDKIMKEAAKRGQRVKPPVELPTGPPEKIVEPPKPELPEAVIKKPDPVIKPDEKPPVQKPEEKPAEKPAENK